jgi:hypothetical protein
MNDNTYKLTVMEQLERCIEEQRVLKCLMAKAVESEYPGIDTYCFQITDGIHTALISLEGVILKEREVKTRAVSKPKKPNPSTKEPFTPPNSATELDGDLRQLGATAVDLCEELMAAGDTFHVACMAHIERYTGLSQTPTQLPERYIYALDSLRLFFITYRDWLEVFIPHILERPLNELVNEQEK